MPPSQRRFPGWCIAHSADEDFSHPLPPSALGETSIQGESEEDSTDEGNEGDEVALMVTRERLCELAGGAALSFAGIIGLQELAMTIETHTEVVCSDEYRKLVTSLAFGNYRACSPHYLASVVREGAAKFGS